MLNLPYILLPHYGGEALKEIEFLALKSTPNFFLNLISNPVLDYVEFYCYVEF